MFRKVLIFLVLFAGIFVLAYKLTIILRTSQAEQLPFLGEVRQFELFDTQGEPFGLQDLHGQIWVVDFMFTTCGSICPTLTRNMKRIQENYSNAENFTLVSITVHPEYDTPEILAKYADKYGARTAQWYFLTGSREKIEELARESFKIGSVEEPVFHSSYFVLIDGKGRIRGYYDGTDDADIGKLTADIQKLLDAG